MCQSSEKDISTVEAVQPENPQQAHLEPKSSSTPNTITSPCPCSCGKCCCQSQPTLEPKHCVRCHATYTYNHPDACWVPHVFEHDVDGPDVDYRALVSRSSCCGRAVYCVDPVKGDWQQPSLCVWGWHTTNVLDVEKAYNGINVLKCLPGPDGRCVRKQLKYEKEGSEKREYKLIYEEEVKYERGDKEDRNAFYKRLVREMGKEYLRDDYDLKVKKRRGEHAENGPDELRYKKLRPWQSDSESDSDSEGGSGAN